MTDADLLYEQIKRNPDDEILLGAFADCLDEDGQTDRAGLVRELMTLRQSIRSEPHPTDLWKMQRDCDLLLYRLGLTDIRMGDRLGIDENGRVYPLRNGNGAVATVVEVPDECGTVVVRMGGFPTHRHWPTTLVQAVPTV
jgi:uncharacterized protein (TIGR02996 family)